MKPKLLYIKNFGTISEVELDLENRGLTLVLGENNDAPKASSNGAGKSLLLDALVWCLWGKTARGIKHDDVVNEIVDADCKVQVTLTDASHTYIVTRYRKHRITAGENKDKNDLTLSIDGVDVSKSVVSDTQEKVSSILGVDFDTFCALMPGTGVRAAALGDSGIKDLLDKILQTQVYSKAAQKGSQASRDRLFASIEELLVDYQAKFASFETDKQAKIDKAVSSLGDLGVKVLQLDNLLATKTAEAAVRSTKEKECLAKSKEIVPLKDVLASITKDYEYMKATYLADKRDATTRIGIKKARLQGLLGLGPTCTSCEQGITAEWVRGCTGPLEADIAQIEAEMKAQDDRYIEARLGFETAIGSAKAAVHNAEVEVHGLVKELNALGQPDRDLIKIKADIANTESNIEAQEKAMASLVKEVNPFADMIVKAEINHKDAIHQVELAARLLEKDTLALKRLKFWSDAFSNQGIRSHILKSVTPVLNEKAKHNSDLLTGGEMQVTFHTQKELKSGAIKEEFQICVKQMHGGSTYDKNSTGERARADIVIAMTLSDLAAMRAKHIPFRFLDEPFEHIDEAGVSAVVSVLTEYRKKYDTIFVITHLDALKSLFSSSITLVKTNGISKLRE